MCIYIYNGYYPAIKKNETMLFATTWMDLEITVLSPGKFPKVPGRRRGTRGFPAAPRERPRESFFNASRGPSPLP